MKYKKFTKKEISKGYPYTLKEFPNGPVLKDDGTSYNWGTIIPLIGGESLACSLATQTKPKFLLSYSAFGGNDAILQNYWPDVPYHNLDDYDESICGDDAKDLNELKKYFNQVDFVNAVPPCAGLSQMNCSKGSDKSRGADAVQNDWLYKSSRFVLEHVKPKVLWGENAPALFTTTGKGVADKMALIAKEFGYSFSLMKTNSLLHGIPQKRERTFYFFWDSKTAPVMNYIAKETIPMIDYLNQLPKGIEHGDEFSSDKLDERFPSYQYLLDKEGLTHAEFIAKHPQHTLHGYITAMGLLDEVKDFLIDKYGEDFSEVKVLNHITKKLDDNKGWWDASPHFFYTHFNAVVARNMWCGLHPVERRYMTIRELLWLMAHPWDFNFVRNEKGGYNSNALAQNVPVLTARDMALNVMDFINGKLPLSGEENFRQNNHKPIVAATAKSLF